MTDRLLVHYAGGPRDGQMEYVRETPAEYLIKIIAFDPDTLTWVEDLHDKYAFNEATSTYKYLGQVNTGAP